jgi:hypothetical protein
MTDMPITEPKARAELYRRATESWEHLKKTHRDTWAHYDTIGIAMVEARNEIMHARDLNQPVGPGYQQDMKRWLIEHRLDDMEKGVRSRLSDLIDHRQEVEEMMAKWSVTQRMEWNHPNTVHRRWKAWRAGKGSVSKTQKQKLTIAKQTSQELASALERINELEEEVKSARETAPPTKATILGQEELKPELTAAADAGKQFQNWPLAARRQFVNDATLDLLIKSAAPADQDKLRKGSGAQQPTGEPEAARETTSDDDTPLVHLQALFAVSRRAVFFANVMPADTVIAKKDLDVLIERLKGLNRDMASRRRKRTGGGEKVEAKSRT